MHHHSTPTRWLHLAVLLLGLCACTLPTYHYRNAAHANYGAKEFSADLTQCRNRSATVVVSTQGYDLQSGVGVDEVKTNACMAAQGWQPAPLSISGIVPL